MTSRRPSVGWLLMAVLLLVLAFGLRVHCLGDQSLWYDEGTSVRAAERDASTIVAGAAHDIHPPGYNLLLAGWEDFVGDSEFALRFLSVLLSLLSVALIGAIGRRLFSPSTGLLVMLLAAVNPFQIWYAQEARMYAMLGAVSAASVLLTVEVLSIPGQMTSGRFQARRAAAVIGGFVLVNTLGLYTHYTFPFVLLAESVGFLVWLMGRPQKMHGIVTWALLNLASLALFAPWLSVAYRQLTTWPRVLAPEVGLVQLAGATAYGLTLPPEAVRAGLVPLLILALAGLLPPIDPERRYLRFSERIALVALWVLVPVAIPVAMGVVREPFLKFFVPSGLALQLLVARGVVMVFRLGRRDLSTTRGSMLGGWLTRLIAVLLLITGLLQPVSVGLANLYENPAYARDDYRGIAHYIKQAAGPEAAVVLDAPSQVEVFTYYYPDGPGVMPLPDDHTELTLHELMAHHDRIYALYWGASEQDPEHSVETMLNAHAYAADSRWFGDVRLVTYVTPAEGAEAPQVSADVRFGDDIVLEGYALSAETLQPGDALAVTLFWRTDSELWAHYKVFVHLYYPDGTLAAQHDSEPAGGLAPTDSWAPGEQVADNHGLLLPADAPPGSYTLMVGLYSASGERLPLDASVDAGDQRLKLADIEVVP